VGSAKVTGSVTRREAAAHYFVLVAPLVAVVLGRLRLFDRFELRHTFRSELVQPSALLVPLILVALVAREEPGVFGVRRQRRPVADRGGRARSSGARRGERGQEMEVRKPGQK
jgi:hypothetical protein